MGTRQHTSKQRYAGLASFLAAIVLLLSSPVMADTVALPFTFVPFTTILSSQVNQNFAVIYNAFNGSISDVNIKNGANINPNKIANLSFNSVRVYGTSGDPLADATNVSTIFAGPYQGTQVSFFDGISRWVPASQSENSLVLTGLASGSYDIYEYNNAGVATVETPPTAWSGGTPPSRTLVTGIWCKGTDTTRRLIGAINFNGTSLSDNQGNRQISNVCIPVERALLAIDPATSWTDSNTTPHATNNNTTNGQGRFSVFCALATTPVELTYFQQCQSAAAGGSLEIGIMKDTTSSFNLAEASFTAYAINASGSVGCGIVDVPATGLHSYQKGEANVAAAGTGYGLVLGGLYGTIKN